MCVCQLAKCASPQLCLPPQQGVDKQAESENQVKKVFLVKLICTDLSNSNLPAGGQKVVHVPSTLGCRQLWLRKEHQSAVISVL